MKSTVKDSARALRNPLVNLSRGWVSKCTWVNWTPSRSTRGKSYWGKSDESCVNTAK